MAGFTIKGHHVGTGRPLTIVSLMGADEEALLAGAEAAVRAGAEVLEWRADFFAQLADAEAVAATCRSLMAALPATPLILTVRTRGQGGQTELDAQAYVALYQAVVEQGRPDLIDIELSIGDDAVRDLVAQAHEASVRAIVSHHDFAATPPTAWMANTLRHMAGLGADIPKLAVMAQSASDALRLMEATAQVREELGLPLLTMAMGPEGAISRLAGESFGSALTFCALGTPSAPGQVGLAQARAALDALHAALNPTSEEGLSA